MFLTTEPPISAANRAFLEQVVDLVAKGYFSYVVILGPDIDIPAYEAELKNYVEAVKQKTATTHPDEDMRYLCVGRFCLVMATPGIHDILAYSRVRVEDVRKTPIPCFGYGISCKKAENGYSVLVNGLSGKLLDFPRGSG